MNRFEDGRSGWGTGITSDRLGLPKPSKRQ
jgi:hypothetical protein